MTSKTQITGLKYYPKTEKTSTNAQEVLTEKTKKITMNDLHFTCFDSSKYNTEKIPPEEFNGEITFGSANNTHMNKFYSKPVITTDIPCNSRSISINNVIVTTTTDHPQDIAMNTATNYNNHTDANLPQTKSLRRLTPQMQGTNSVKKQSKTSKYNLSYFIDGIGAHNSFVTVVLHLLYQMKPLRGFILNTCTENKVLNEIKNIWRWYPDNKRIDVTALRSVWYEMHSKTNAKNKFEINHPNDPCELYSAVLNIIHSSTNNDLGTTNRNCGCIVHKTAFLNLTKIDECECMERSVQNCSGSNYITDIPIESVLQKSITKTDNIYFSRERLFSFFKSWIESNHRNAQCALNGCKSDFHRVRRIVLLNNRQHPTQLVFAFDFGTRSSWGRQYRWFDILHMLILIPMALEIENLFTVAHDSGSAGAGIFEFCGLVFIKPSKAFSCMIKSARANERKVDWVYFDDEMVFVYSSWMDIISIALKNGLIPYILYYRFNVYDDRVWERQEEKKGVSKEEFKILEHYARRLDGFKMNSGLRVRVKEGWFEEGFGRKDGASNGGNREMVQDQRMNGKNGVGVCSQQGQCRRERQRPGFFADDANGEGVDGERKYENMPWQIHPPSNESAWKPDSTNEYSINAHSNQTQIPFQTQKQCGNKAGKPGSVHKQHSAYYTVSSGKTHNDQHRGNMNGKSIEIGNVKKPQIVQEDRIRPYQGGNPGCGKVKRDDDKTRFADAPGEWQCLNCDSFNSEYYSHCENCKMGNYKQNHFPEFSSDIPGRGPVHILSPSHFHGIKSNVHTIPTKNNHIDTFNTALFRCYTCDKEKGKDKYLHNELCVVCDRNPSESDAKNSIVEKAITFNWNVNTQKNTKSKECSPENNYIATPCASHFQNQNHSNHPGTSSKNSSNNTKKSLIEIPVFPGGDDSNDTKFCTVKGWNAKQTANKTPLDVPVNTASNNTIGKYKNSNGNPGNTGVTNYNGGSSMSSQMKGEGMGFKYKK